MRKLIHRLVCRPLGHRWKTHNVTIAGVLTVIPRCERCRHVDIDRITSTNWARRDRRRWKRALRRA